MWKQRKTKVIRGKCGIRGQKCKYHAGMYGVSWGYLRGIMPVSREYRAGIVRGDGRLSATRYRVVSFALSGCHVVG